MREERIAKASLALLLVGTLTFCLVAVVARATRAQSGLDGKDPKRQVPNKKAENAKDATPAIVDAENDAPSSADPTTDAKANATIVPRQGLVASLTILVLAVVVGFELITKVPPTLHTPLMSGSNAISGITIVGAIIVTGVSDGEFASMLGFIAVIMATVNCVGGFLVTHRMLLMFAKPR